jgi:lipoyl(octanoyl) transferase
MIKSKQICRLYDLTRPATAAMNITTPTATIAPLGTSKEQQGTLIPYLTGWKYQKSLMDKIYSTKVANSQNYFLDSVLLLQHSSVYTLGKGATVENLKFPHMKNSDGKEVYRVSRGGEVTWHGPGQLVVYPIIDLNRHKKDLRWYLSNLEDVVIATLSHHGINGTRSPVNPGVWVDRNKICAVGITCSRWITMHGLALNVDCDLKAYSHIIPCGISPEIGGVCSMKQFDNSISIESVKTTFLQKFQQQFQYEDMIEGSRSELEQLVFENPEVVKESFTLSTL